MPTDNYNPRIDAYIHKAQPFAQPILTHLRGLIHTAVPSITEEIKWSHPFFLVDGTILGNMAAFKQHCSFGFWGREIAQILQEQGVLTDGAMGSLGRITSLKDLPSDKQLLTWLRQAADSIAAGTHTSIMTGRQTMARSKPAKPASAPTPELTAALQKNKKVAKIFAAFSPSAQREYTDWIADAKRPETRDKRIAQAIEWIAEGKQRNWKYQTK